MYAAYFDQSISSSMAAMLSSGVRAHEQYR